MERPWLNHYPAGVPAQIDADRYPSIPAVFAEACQRFAGKPAFTCLGTTLEYAEVDRLSARFAAYLIGELHLKRGDRVALMMPNSLQYPVAILGALRAGLVVVNTNPMYTARELHHQLVDSGARVVVAMEMFAHTLEHALHDTRVEHVVITRMGDLLGRAKGTVVDFVLRHVRKQVPDYHIPGATSFHDALKRGARHPVEDALIQSGDLAFLQYTGGTTGVAKGAMLTHRNLIANMLQASAWVGGDLKDGEEAVITALPLYHIFALTANCLVFLRIGGHNHLIVDPRDMPGFVRQLQKTRFSAITGVNTLFNGLLHTPGFERIDFSQLKVSLGGGMAVQRAVAERWKQATGVPLIEAYGLTETSPAVCINPLDLADYNGAIGLPIPSTDCCLKDEDGHALTDTDAVGELCVRGPQVMAGYWRQAEETAKVIDAEGWLHTGDMARMDAGGFFYIVDRKKDMILVSGFNVYPNEVEDVLAAMPGVREAVVVGVPDEHSGEVVKAVIVRSDPSLTVAQVKAWCHHELTGYKRPRIIEFRDSVPKTNVGKPLRRELRDPAPVAAGGSEAH